MAFITLSGTLLDPNGDLAVGDQIRFTHNSSTGQTVESAISIITINPAGTYSLPLQYGLVLVEYKCVRSQQFKNLGVATVNGTNTATSIPELLNALVPVSSAELIEFQAILADCVAAKVAAEAAAATIDLINDLSLTYNFATVALFKASTILFPNGKRVYLTDRDAYFNKITGNTATTDNDIIFSTAVNQSIVLITQGLAVSEQFGFSTKDQLQTFLASDGNQYKHEAYGRFSTLNGRDDTVGVFDVANFAGQTAYSSEPIGFVFHHYTDGTLMQVDNVGQANNILILKNAQNTNRRPDKASDFVGSGNFLALDTHNNSLDYTERYFYIDKDCKFVWTGVKGIATLWQNKAEDGVPAFRNQTTNKHTVMYDFFNGLSDVVYKIKNDVTFTRLTFEVDVSQTSGMLFETKAGGIRLLPANGKIEAGGAIQAISGNTLITAPSAKMAEFQTPVLLRQYSTATLPSASVYASSTVSISDSAGKPSPLVYSDGTNWLYMDNTTV